MSVGLIALLDDVAALAKAAAASLDDVAAQAVQAGGKAAGVVIDDAAVTPRYVTGFAAAREVPTIARIALGSLRNKILILLPAALLLSALLPAAVTPLLMAGGVYLAYEGAEKIFGLIAPHAAEAHEAEIDPIDPRARSFEDAKVASAIRTDFILSAEIMAITLASVEGRPLAMQAAVLAAVGIGITAAVYGAVALIVKADDFGLWLARLRAGAPFGPPLRALGRTLVVGMPPFLALLGFVGTAAMIWVGGGIVVHGLEQFGLAAPAHLLHALGGIAADALPFAAGFARWFGEALGAGLCGLALGFLTIPLTSHAVAPLWRRLRARFA
ncbi:MAG: DUF808 domain-containing protein [Hyphomicrobiales bacterium]|uniref:DUF808 domain-containing protein n=1 Tax=Rhabdaerophilum calidifontis TaxID=2604328 RepID=UPI00123B0BC7|nr:DUF808 domain-containing protein [Rhabdaerophilum calidifontis]MCA1952338.1 DUF808 domain-containing protein [Hyphomicrobiales bacterium]MCA1999010.1 DUF808 domain-containing protein [Hyphomicrobiales bacterium]